MKKAFFAVPSYRGIRNVPFFESLEKTIHHCQENGWTNELSVLSGNCYVQLARNELIKQFRESDCDSLFFLDDDISWNCEDALKLLEMDDDIVAGIYPHKTEDENYPVVINTVGDNYLPKVREDGCIYASHIPFGFVRIKRHVIEKMWDTYANLKYIHYREGCMGEEYRDLFPQGVKNERWIGEDYAFCQLWTDLGGEIIVVPDIDFYHHRDTISYKGNYHEFLLRQPGGSKHDPSENYYYGNDIFGFMSLVELKWLHKQSSKYDSVVEIGSFKGRSTHALLSGLAKKITCIDPWNYVIDNLVCGEEQYQEFLRNVEPVRGGNGRLNVIRGLSVEASKNHPDVDMVFIDGNHDYEYIKADIEAWLPKTRKLICGHDYSWLWRGVKQAVKESFGDKFRVHDTIWYVEL